MATDKEDILTMIKQLPDDVSVEDILDAIYVRQKISKGLKDSEEGKVYTTDEARAILEKWLK